MSGVYFTYEYLSENLKNCALSISFTRTDFLNFSDFRMGGIFLWNDGTKDMGQLEVKVNPWIRNLHNFLPYNHIDPKFIANMDETPIFLR
jgi:hypothetical protein